MRYARLCTTLVLGAALAAGSAQPVTARVGQLPVQQLAEQSEVIVVGRVIHRSTRLFGARVPSDSILGIILGNRIASARVEDVWKGRPGRVVRFIASPTWTCDTSAAVVGERVLLFLAEVPGRPWYYIAHSGRGRMPIHRHDERLYVRLTAIDLAWVDPTESADPLIDFDAHVGWPSTVPMLEDTSQGWHSTRTVPLTRLREHVGLAAQEGVMPAESGLALPHVGE